MVDDLQNTLQGQRRALQLAEERFRTLGGQAKKRSGALRESDRLALLEARKHVELARTSINQTIVKISRAEEARLNEAHRSRRQQVREQEELIEKARQREREKTARDLEAQQKYEAVQARTQPQDQEVEQMLQQEQVGQQQAQPSPQTTTPHQTPAPTPDPPPTDIHNQIKGILTQSLKSNGQHIEILQDAIDRLPIDDENSNARFKNLAALNRAQDLALHQAVYSNVNELDHLTDHVARAIYDLAGGQPPDEKTIKKAVKQTIGQVRLENPIIASVLDKPTTNQIIKTFQDKQYRDLSAGKQFQQEVIEELEKNWHDVFGEAQRRQLSDKISQTLARDAYLYPNKAPQELIYAHLTREARNNPESRPPDEHVLDSKASQSASALSTSGQLHQLNARYSKPPENRLVAADPDPFFALNQNQSPLYGINHGFVHRFFRNRSYNSLLKTAAGIPDEKIHQLIPDNQGRSFTLDQKRQLIRAQIYQGLSLYEQGINESWLDNFHHHIQGVPGWAKKSLNASALQNIQQLKNSRALTSQLMSQYPQAVNSYTKFWAGWHRAVRAPGKLDAFGLRYKIPFTSKIVGERWGQITSPLTKLAYKPFIAFDNFTYKINPLAHASGWLGNKVKMARGKVGVALANKGAKILAAQALKKGAKAAAAKLAGKLLLKAGAAIAGVGTGGLGTALAVISIAKDLYQMIGAKNLKNILLLGGAAVAYLLNALWSFIAGNPLIILGSTLGAAIGGFIWGAPGALIGAAIGGFIGSKIAAIWGSLGSTISSAAAAVAGAASLTFNSLVAAAAVIAKGAAATVALSLGITGAAVGGFTGIEKMHKNTALILPSKYVSGGQSVPLDGICWPVPYGRISANPAHHETGPVRVENAARCDAYDIAAPEDTPVYSIFPGTVIASGWNNYGYGYMVEIQVKGYEVEGRPECSGDFTVKYAHLQSSLFVTPGQEIDIGGADGQSGVPLGTIDGAWSGNSSGAHLHYEFCDVDISCFIPQSSGSFGQMCPNPTSSSEENVAGE